MDPIKDQKEEPIDGELVEIARNPSVPVTVTDLAALREKGQEIIRFRVEILKTLRLESLRMSFPEDWLLFRADMNGVEIITGYLQDTGAARIQPLWAIQIHVTSDPPFEKTVDGEEYSYSITGWGENKTTGINSEMHTGIRYSYEDFCKDIPHKLKKEAYVKLAARANLDGHIIRELAGLERVPVQELADAWKENPGKTISRCAKGRGFGSGDSRVGGATASGIDAVDIPNCEGCAAMKPPVVSKLVLRTGKGDREGFYGCKNYEAHPEKKVIIPISVMKKRIEEKKAAEAKQAPGREAGDEQ